MSGARRIEMVNRELGNCVKKQGFIFLISNTFAAIGYYLMSHKILVFG